jgi:hypothetical protein
VLQERQQNKLQYINAINSIHAGKSHMQLKQYYAISRVIDCELNRQMIKPEAIGICCLLDRCQGERHDYLLFHIFHIYYTNVLLQQRKAWRIPSPKHLTQ